MPERARPPTACLSEVSLSAREPGFLSFPNGLLNFLALTNRIEALIHRDGYALIRPQNRGLLDSSSSCIVSTDADAPVFLFAGG